MNKNFEKDYYIGTYKIAAEINNALDDKDLHDMPIRISTIFDSNFENNNLYYAVLCDKVISGNCIRSGFYAPDYSFYDMNTLMEVIDLCGAYEVLTDKISAKTLLTQEEIDLKKAIWKFLTEMKYISKPDIEPIYQQLENLKEIKSKLPAKVKLGEKIAQKVAEKQEFNR